MEGVDLDRWFTPDEASYLSRCSVPGIIELAVDGGRVFIPEFVQQHPAGFTFCQTFGLAALIELRRRGWTQGAAVNAGRWFAAQDAFQLEDLLDSGKRFLAVRQAKDRNTMADERMAMCMLLDEDQLQTAIASLMPQAVEWDMTVSVADAEAAWAIFVNRVGTMDKRDDYGPSLN